MIPGNSFLDNFKETEIGPIPVDWDVVQLGKACQLGRENVDPQELPEMPYVGLEHIESGEPKLRRWGNSSEVKSSKKHFHPGDVLYGKLRPYLDKAVLAEIEGICSTDILVLKADPDRTMPEFLVHSLHTKQFLSYAVSTTTGTNLPRTRWTSLKGFKLALPPLPEQRRIAHVLSTIQRAIAAQDDLIAAAREVKRSLMQRLFTYGPGPEPAPTKETEIGEIPEHWEVRPANQVFERITDGTHDTPGKLPAGIPLVTSKLIKQSRVLIALADYFISYEDHEEVSKRSGIDTWDVLYSMIGTIGEVAVIRPEYPSFSIKNVGLFKSGGNRLLAEYTAYWLQSDNAKNFAMLRASGTSQKYVPLGLLRKFPIPYPSVSEQHEIVTALSAAEHKIEAEEQRKAALQALFKAMLQQLMTGQIRMNAGADSHCMPL